MPKIINHDERRADIAESVLRVIAKYGIEKTTVRGIALEGGFSSGTLAHYFRDKADLVAFAFQYIADTDFAEIEKRAAKAAPGLERLRISLEQLLYDPSRRGGVAVSVGFWSAAMSHPKLAEIHRRNYDRWREYVHRFLREAVSEGQVVRKMAPDDTVDLFIASVDGLCVAMTLEPARYPVKRRRHILDQLLAGLLERAS